ncbi:MAG: adenosylmethionine--8-amino-7-oxononanoate transaminase [Polyangia bacterium]
MGATREQIVALDKKLLWHPYTPMQRYIEKVDPVVVDRAKGIHLYDKDGSKLIDGNASWWVNILGHNHPRLMEAIRRQTETLAHCSMAGTIHEPAVRLAESLLPRCGESYSRLFFSDDGSTAVEVAVRMAHQYWRNVGKPEKNRFVTLAGAFHGETVGAASVSGAEVFHEALGDLLFERVLLPSPARAEAGAREGEGEWHEEAFARAAGILAEAAEQIAAIIVEPLVQGAAGMLMYPPRYLQRLRELTEKLDILLIADEVFVGYGRTGSFLAGQRAGIEADILCLAKGFSGGVLPMAATLTTNRIFEAFLGDPSRTLWYGHSFTGNPLGCAVAIETLKIFDDERIVERLPEKCAAMQRGLDSISDHPWVRDVRRTGMIGAFTLISPKAGEQSADYLAGAGWRFYTEARKRGALLRPLGNVVYFVLPLNIEEPQVDELFSIVGDSLQAAFD